jgi:hypothetical protein
MTLTLARILIFRGMAKPQKMGRWVIPVDDPSLPIKDP